MSAPSYDAETLAGYFQPLHAAIWQDPIVGPVLRQLEVDDPDLIAAVADVDRSQIRDCLDWSPAQRLEFAASSWRALSRWRVVG